MIVSLFLNREAFAAKRRKAQDDYVARLHDLVADSVKNGVDLDDLHDLIETLFADAYKDEAGEDWAGPGSVVEKLQALVDSLLDKTKPDSDVNATTLAIASLIINTAAVRAAQDDEDDLFLEWVTMHDGAVRQAHKDTDGQIRPIGEKFDVDGTDMSMPGDITAPIELWINCRCTLRPTLPPEFHVRETPFRDVSEEERKKDAKEGRAMPDGSYPIDNCQDLRNAIQAIGRAKDPAKVKAHIKKRKRALGCPDVEIPDSWAEILYIPAFMQHTGPWPTWTTTSTNVTITQGAHTMSTQTDEKPIATPEDDEALNRLAQMDEEQQAAFESLVPWHGVLAPEDVKTGDGRMFAKDSLRNRDLPLPLTYQKSSDDGHKGSVTVGSIETIERVDGLMLATGYFLSTPEADEAIGLIAHFGKYGVSVDTDDVEFDYDEAAEQVTFTSARICSASLVSIPAFAEAYITLGPWAEDEALVASGSIFKDLAPGKTEDGPGWLTHPVDTDRLRDYWVRGPGAAKIGWGTPGDFNRCRLNLAKYVKPQYLSGYCANRHYDALGFWPGRPVAAETIPFDADEQAPALSLVASAVKQIKAPAVWFGDPGLTEETHLTVTDEGHIYGHIARWGVCHIGINGVCTEPPRSETNYAYFANKRVLLDDGTYARTGVITVGGKHAPGRLGMAQATQHYDDNGKGVADVSIGEDEFGIWVNGWIRPGADPQDVYTLDASDVSGDWRGVDRWAPIPDLVAVVTVNAGGFPVKVAASEGGMISLVAAGMITREETPAVELPDVDRFAEAIAKAMERVERNKIERAATMATLRAKHEED